VVLWAIITVLGAIIVRLGAIITVPLIYTNIF